MMTNEEKLQILFDTREIENLMGRYAHLHSMGRDREILNTLFSSLETTTIEDGSSGVYELHGRIGGFKGYMSNFYGMPDDDNVEQTQEPGRLHAITLSSPFIQIAPDGKTATGYWMGQGVESRVFPDGQLSGIPSVDAKEPDSDGMRHSAFWIWNRYEVEFIREDGAWKIWHLHIYDIFRTPYDRDWVDYSKKDRMLDDEAWDTQVRCVPPATHATIPTKYHWQYHPEALPPTEPVL